jgi:hypothetical protein
MSVLRQEALRDLHAVHSNQPHPLLADRGIIDAPAVGTVSDRPESPVEGNLDRLEESLGTLTIDSQSGQFSFFGQSAGMEVCLPYFPKPLVTHLICPNSRVSTM